MISDLFLARVQKVRKEMTQLVLDLSTKHGPDVILPALALTLGRTAAAACRSRDDLQEILDKTRKTVDAAAAERLDEITSKRAPLQ